MVSAAKAMGQTAIAITDHGVMYGVIDFYEQAKAQGIKPVIGCEVYVANTSRFDRGHSKENESFHLVLLCKDYEGYKNLCKLVSLAWTEGFYMKPRVDRELLEQYHGGLIALSACLAGEVARSLSRDNYEAAKAAALYYRTLFGENNYYLEMQDHSMHEQLVVNDGLARISRETGIPLVVTNDSHYISRADAKMHEVLLCIQTKDVITNPDAFRFPSDEFYLKSEEEMAQLVPDYPEAIENTAKIAERCNVEFVFGETKLPRFDVPDGREHYEYFRELCFAGLHEHYGENPAEEVTQRLEYELSTINSMGYVDYYLIVNDFVRYAKNNKIPVGPGRGSGAGSLAAYCMGITAIDPIRFGLLFERFLNPERISMPDFDIDFSDELRWKVIDYVVKKYGDDHVAQIVTFGTLKARAAIRDVARAMNIPYNIADRVAKLVPEELKMTLDKALKISLELKSLYESDMQIRSLVDMALKVEGMPRHASKHAAGVVITDNPVDTYVPLAKNDDAVVTQYPMNTLEHLGLLKIDFLSIRNLTVIEDTADMIRLQNPDFDINKIDMDDKGVFEMLSNGFAEGVFQFESEGIKRVLTQLIPESIEDLIAVISLYRPGPMASIPKYIENRHNPALITYSHPLLEGILKVTNGCIVYQEQVMQICRELAGYSLGRADLVRRAMSKKKHSEMEREREVFINGLSDENGNIIVDGAVRRGVPKDVAEAIFSQIQVFSEYAFNKSHAAAYAVIAYQTAFLKCNYKQEYMSALFTSVLDRRSKISAYMAECQRMGVKVLPPDVNESSLRFTVNGDSIRFGLLAIKNLGRGMINGLIEERERRGKYKSFYNFCERLNGKEINKRAIESLIKSGAMDSLAKNRRQMLESLNTVLSDVTSKRNGTIDGQLGFFDLPQASMPEPALPDVEEYPQKTLLAMEKEVTELYLSGHPMLAYEAVAKQINKGIARISELINAQEEGKADKLDGMKITVLAMVEGVKKKTSKANETMAFCMIEDISASMEVIVFPKLYTQSQRILIEGDIIAAEGRVSIREDEEPKLIAERIYSLDECRYNLGDETLDVKAYEKKKLKDTLLSDRRRLYIRTVSIDSEAFWEAKYVIRKYRGPLPVYVYSLVDEKTRQAPMDMWITPDDELIRELRKLLGEDNVVLR
jgi:DNA polymerase-3 subunit alpha